jgi:hypothetical protein
LIFSNNTLAPKVLFITGLSVGANTQMKKGKIQGALRIAFVLTRGGGEDS